MRRGIVLVVALLVALVPAPQALAAACSSTVFNGIALIVGDANPNDIWVKANGANLECREGSAGAYTAVGAMASITKIIIDIGPGFGAVDDDVHIGEPTSSANLITPPIDVHLGNADDDSDQQLVIDASSETLNSLTSISGSSVGGAGGVTFSGVNDLIVRTGSGDDSFLLQLEEPMPSVQMHSGLSSEGNSLTVFGTAAADTVNMQIEGFFQTVVWDAPFSDPRLIPVGIAEVTFDLGTGNDKLIAVEPWGGIPIEALGGDGKDVLHGQSEADNLEGNAGNDKLVGGAGPDTIKGGGGRDICKGGPGKDVITSCERVTA